ncbi:MAG: phosphoribosyltransferase family protein [Bacteroidota bacterium]|nr:phosphoribosyltransferase family protein [Bacteroidota bacterium]
MNTILTHDQVQHKIRRIAFQIAEVFYEEHEIILAGIKGQGFQFASLLKVQLDSILQGTVTICEVKIDKKNPLSPISTSLDSNLYKDKVVVLCDDVLNSGSTLIYSVKHFLDTPIKKMKTAVLVDRNHKRYPVKADFKGISLSTNLKEHVEVFFDSNDSKVLLK